MIQYRHCNNVTDEIMANNLLKQLEDLSESIESIIDEQTKSIFHKLLNVVETLSSDNAKLRAENQRLRDENNQLKGEQGQPSIRQQTSGKGKPHDSEKERKLRGKKKKKKTKRKKHKITVDRTEKCEMDVSLLPPDAEFKGYQSVVIQDIKSARIMLNFCDLVITRLH